MEKKTIIYLYLAILSAAFLCISLLVLLTRGKPSLVKRKLLLGGLIITLTGAMNSCTLCSPPPACYSVEPDHSRMCNDWMDNATYCVIVASVPDQKAATKVARRESSRELAIRGARDKILQQFATERMKVSNETADYNTVVQIMRNTFSDVIRKGQVKSCIWDEEDDCEIEYEVKDTNLRQKVMSVKIQ